MKNKIGWCNTTWNPVWGCNDHCKYCYARRIASFRYDQIAEKEYQYMQNRDEIYQGEFANRLRHFVPTFIQSNFDKKFPQKTQKIFVGSMSEIRFWKREWISKVFKKIEEYPQHDFQFLTKYPYIYHRLEFPARSWLGFTVTTDKDLANGMPHIEKLRTRSLTGRYLYFISIEPVLECIDPGLFSNANIDWVILGAETGDRKGKIIPKKDWIENIVNYCEWNNIPVYLKDSLKNIYPEKIKIFPNYK